MRRRRFVALAPLAALTGCAASDTDDDPSPTPQPPPEPSPTPTPIPTPTGSPTPAPPEVAAELVVDARDILRTATGELRSGSDAFAAIPDAYDIDDRILRSDLGDARSVLDDAEAYGDDAQLTEIEALRSYAAVIEDAVGVASVLLDIHAAADRVGLYRRSERWDDAVTETEATLATAEDAIPAVTRLREAVDGVDDAAGGGPPIGVDTTRGFLDDLEASLNGIVVLSRGTIPYLRGLQAHDRGIAALDAEEYDDADRHFADAVPRFEEAEAVYRAGEDQPDTGYRTDIIRETCRADREAEACTHYEAAAEAADDGDFDLALDENARGDEIWDRVCE